VKQFVFLGALAALVAGCSSISKLDKPTGIPEVISTWVMPLRAVPRFDLSPYERTKPIVLGDILYTADLQGRVLAVHRTLGYILWETKMPAGVSGAFAYGRSKLIVGDKQGNLIALNARDGSEAWRFKVGSEWLAPPSVSLNHVFAVTSAGDLYALGESNGREIWHYNRRGDEKMTILGSGGPAVYGNSDVFQGFSDGTLVALTAEKGKVIWEKKLKSRERFYDIEMTPYVDDKRVVAATYDGRVYGVNRITGETNWVFPVGSYSGFVVENGRLYFGGVNHQFYAIDLASGQPIWTTAYEGGISATPVILKNILIFPTSSDPTYLVDTQKGKILGRVILGAGTLAAVAPSNDDGWFYALSNYGNLYASELRTDQPNVLAVK
jgi:outer membrane protein assembly factor BamB